MSTAGETRTEKTNIGRGLSAIWARLADFRKNVNWLIALGLISAVANGVVPYVTGRFFDALIGLSRGETGTGTGIGALGWPLWAAFLAVWAIVQLVANNIDWLKDRINRRVETNVWFGIQTHGFSHLFRLPVSYHKNAHINGELQKISMASWRVSVIVTQISNVAPQLLSIMIGLALAASINIALSGVMVVGVLLYVAILVRVLKPIAKHDEDTHHQWNVAWDDSAAAVHQIESVKQSAAETYEIEKARSALMDRVLKLWLRTENSWSTIEFSQRTIVFFTQLIIFALSVRFVATGAITVGELVALNGYSLMFFGPFASLGHSWKNIQNGITAAAQVQDIFDTKTEEYKPKGAVSLGRLKGAVAFRNVRFKYAPDQPEILKGIDLDIKPGQVIALVGESGVGKSTSIQLISGYYFPNEGSVEIDGIDTRKLDLTELRSQISVVPQEVALFNDTLRTNIKYGSFGASDEDVQRVAKEAHMEAFIDSLPQRFDTIVGERGVKLSVGQKQRVAIARAMLRNPAILVLDEPTSALDAETERYITESLEKLMKGRTTFIIAHRLSTVRKADKILVFQKGQIVEQGTHNELVQKTEGVYRKLYEYQIGFH